MPAEISNQALAEYCIFGGALVGVAWYILVSFFLQPYWAKQRIKTGWKVYRRRIAASNWIMVTVAALTFCAATYFTSLSWSKVGLIGILILCCVLIWMTNGKKRR